MNNCDKECEVCPYDKSHMILKSRMLTHLARCSKNHQDAEKEPCPFNSKHIIPIPELRYHMEVCSDRIKIDQFKMKVGDIECPVKNEVPINIEMPASEENWDDEPTSGSVLEKIKETKNKNVILTNAVIGQSKAQRRGFRLEQIKWHGSVQERNKQYKPVTPSCSKNSTTVENEIDLSPIRVPTIASSESREIHNKMMNRNKTTLVNDLESSIKYTDEKLTSSNAACVSDRLAEASSKSYASLIAERQRAASSGKSSIPVQLPLGDEINKSGVMTMQKLTSPVLENRGRGRLVELSPSTSSFSTDYSSSDNKFPTDEHGFLLMPIPGKGRGKKTL
ncbi:uncharacterized protein LOC142333258 isoform X2 [Lycorma delicatula]|uniref:uncharacterized protein LOC142333258 isoform X2 n=1 Tax=Lycorma delicatula TaxID=130591 RepID=UPI003F50E8AB